MSALTRHHTSLPFESLVGKYFRAVIWREDKSGETLCPRRKRRVVLGRFEKFDAPDSLTVRYYTGIYLSCAILDIDKYADFEGTIYRHDNILIEHDKDGPVVYNIALRGIYNRREDVVGPVFRIKNIINTYRYELEDAQEEYEQAIDSAEHWYKSAIKQLLQKYRAEK